MNQHQAMVALRERGVAKVVVHFSGGNDEGGADLTEFFDAADEKVEVPRSRATEDQRYDQATRRWLSAGWVVNERAPDGERGWTQRPATDDEILLAQLDRVLEEPIYDRYGSFAGDFEVYGTVTWDVATGKHEMHGEMRSEWTSF